jgi:hypothetical protein
LCRELELGLECRRCSLGDGRGLDEGEVCHVSILDMACFDWGAGGPVGDASVVRSVQQVAGGWDVWDEERAVVFLSTMESGILDGSRLWRSTLRERIHGTLELERIRGQEGGQNEKELNLFPSFHAIG